MIGRLLTALSIPRLQLLSEVEAQLSIRFETIRIIELVGRRIVRKRGIVFLMTPQVERFVASQSGLHVNQQTIHGMSVLTQVTQSRIANSGTDDVLFRVLRFLIRNQV